MCHIKGSPRSYLQFYNVLSLWSTVAFNDVELNALAFVQRLEAIALDRAEVNEYIVSAFNFDETKALLSIKPFNSSCLHGGILLDLYLYDLFFFASGIKKFTYCTRLSEMTTLYNM